MTDSLSQLLYLDPSTGGILLQVILGGAAGGLVVFKLFWRRILSIFQLVKKDDSVEPDPLATEDED